VELRGDDAYDIEATRGDVSPGVRGQIILDRDAERLAAARDQIPTHRDVRAWPARTGCVSCAERDAWLLRGLDVLVLRTIRISSGALALTRTLAVRACREAFDDDVSAQVSNQPPIVNFKP
jgi:hypothetical protein